MGMKMPAGQEDHLSVVINHLSGWLLNIALLATI